MSKGPWACTYNRQYVSARIQEMFGQNFSLVRFYMPEFFQCRSEDSSLHFYALAKHNNVKTKQIYQQCLSKDKIYIKHWHRNIHWTQYQHIDTTTILKMEAIKYNLWSTDTGHDMDTDMSTLIIFWENGIIQCNHKYRCRVVHRRMFVLHIITCVRIMSVSDTNTLLILSVGATYNMSD
jgi:hypothetical protein